VVANEPGSLGSLSTVIGKNDGNITNLKITNRSQDYFEMLMDIDVKDAKHLTNIIAALRATPVINSVDRARGGSATVAGMGCAPRLVLLLALLLAPPVAGGTVGSETDTGPAAWSRPASPCMGPQISTGFCRL